MFSNGHHRLKLVALLVGMVSIAIGVSSCKRGGGEGASCKRPQDCRFGFRCEDGHCLGGAESACGYLLRCVPLLSISDKETLFGESFRQWLDALAKKPDQRACERRLGLIAQMGRMIVLHRACGPRITE